MDPDVDRYEPLPGHPVRVNPTPGSVHAPSQHAGGLLAAVVAAVVVMVGVVLFLPRYLLAWDLHGGLVPADRAEAVNDIRTTLLQGIGGAVLLGGAYFTSRQLQVAREGQLTERFTSAVGQLGHGSIDIRLGGIYALGRIAIDSKRDRRTCHEVLCAYVRQHAPLPPPSGSTPRYDRPDGVATKRQLAWEAHQRPPLRIGAADVQAALSILGYRPVEGAHEPLDLSRVTLQRANLRAARLACADLHYSDLAGADLSGTDLHLADLTGTQLAAASLMSADLHQADLRTAILWNVRLDEADLRGTDLTGADLSEAHLAQARLEHADLRGADLSGTDLSRVHLDGAIADLATIWPEHFDPGSAGVTITTTGPPIRPQTTWLWGASDPDQDP